MHAWLSASRQELGGTRMKRLGPHARNALRSAVALPAQSVKLEEFGKHERKPCRTSLDLNLESLLRLQPAPAAQVIRAARGLPKECFEGLGGIEWLQRAK